MLVGEARYVVYIAAPREAIFAALTDGAMTRRWAFGRSVMSDWSAGAEIRHALPDGTTEARGRILESDPPRLVRFSLVGCRPGADPAPIVVSYDIEPFGGMCRLIITEDHAGGAMARRGAALRVWPLLGSALKTLLETGAVPEVDLAAFAAEED